MLSCRGTKPSIQEPEVPVWGGGSGNTNDPLIFDIKKTSEKQFANKTAIQTTYKITGPSDWSGQRFDNVLDQLQEMFKQLLLKVRSSNAGSLICIIIHSDGQAGDIVVPLTSLDTITVKDILDIVEGVQQSNKDAIMGSKFIVTVGLIKVPSGSARKGTVTHTAANALGSSCCVSIKNSDNGCFYRAIGVAWVYSLQVVSNADWNALQRIHNQTDIDLMFSCRKTTEKLRNAVRDSRYKNNFQTRVAQWLCRNSGLVYNRIGDISMIPPVERFLNVRIAVIDGSRGNDFVRRGTGAQPRLDLYRSETADGHHFDVISKIQSFWPLKHICEICLSPFKKQCETCAANGIPQCQTCKRAQCVREPYEPRTCRICKLTFRNQTCFEIHRSCADRSNSKSYCDSHLKCVACGQIEKLKARGKSIHKCFTTTCIFCQKKVAEDHLCYCGT